MTNKLNRRSFFAALTGLPFIRRFTKQACPQCGSSNHYKGVHIDFRGATAGSFTYPLEIEIVELPAGSYINVGALSHWSNHHA